MSDERPRRITRELTGDEVARLQHARKLVADELPDLIARDQMRCDAAKEPTVSGEFRRALHKSKIPFMKIAAQAGITPIMLDEFLTGERNLRSDVLDRIAAVLGLNLQLVSSK